MSAEGALGQLCLIAQRHRYYQLCFVLDLRTVARLAGNRISNHALEHICDHGFVPLFERGLARPEVLQLVNSRLISIH